jgi:hypothetical protein
MPKTAYSKHFGKELDLEQLIALIGGGAPSETDQDVREVPDSVRDWVKADLECPFCGAEGAQIVSSSKAKNGGIFLRQAHFRFQSPECTDSHHPFCDFHRNDQGTKQSETLVNFGSEKSEQTRTVRELVCRAIEQRVFDQRNIRDMRQWFFNLKVENGLTLDTSVEEIEWVEALRRHYRDDGISFHPSHAEMPNYDWKYAAFSEFTRNNCRLLELVRKLPHNEAARKRARNLVDKYAGQNVFDVSVLEPFYRKTIALWSFVGRNYKKLESSERVLVLSYQFEKYCSPSLMAFCALILYISEWDLNQAIVTLAPIVNGTPAVDQTLGNVVGLNPFHDFQAWKYVIETHRIAVQSPNDLNYKDQLAGIEARLRAAHLAWKQSRYVS